MAGTIEVPDTILAPLTGGSPQPIAAQGIAAKRYQTGLPVRGDMAPCLRSGIGIRRKGPAVRQDLYCSSVSMALSPMICTPLPSSSSAVTPLSGTTVLVKVPS